MDQNASNMWIRALAKSNYEDAGRRAVEVLRQMRAENIPANAFTYTSIMDAYAQIKNPNGRKSSCLNG